MTGRKPRKAPRGTSQVKCAACEDSVSKSDGIVCLRCKAVRHKKKSCVGFSKAAIESDPDFVKDFVCQSCCDLLDSESESSEDAEVSGRESQDSMARVLAIITKIEKKWDKRMFQFEAVIKMCSNQIDDVTNLKKKVRSLEDRSKALESAPKQQEPQFRDVVITNVPPLEGEDTAKIAKLIFDGVGADISPEDIQTASRFVSEINENKKMPGRVHFSSEHNGGLRNGRTLSIK